MTDFYCDISALGNEYQAYTDTPTTWAVPQDGNGKAGPGHAAAVAIATIDVAGCVASGTGTIGVLGVTVSSTLNATGAALATAIATAVNASATAVSATYSSLLLPLNKLVYARVNPGLSTQVQIMLRIAGTDWVGFSPTQANISAAATIGNFAGGSDGPFAYLVNSTVVFGKAVFVYGCWTSLSPGVTDVLGTDITHVRTQRGGVNLTYEHASANLVGTFKPRTFLYDDGTLWGGTNCRLSFTLKNTTASSQTTAIYNPNNGVVNHVSRGIGNFEVIAGGLGSATGITSFFRQSANGSTSFIRCRYIELSGNVNSGFTLLMDGANTTTRFDATDSYVQFNTASKVIISATYVTAPFKIKLNGLMVEVLAASGAIDPIINISGASAAGSLEWIGGEIRDGNGVYKCVNPLMVGASALYVDVLLDGVVGVTDPSAGFTPALNSIARFVWNSPEGPNKGFRFETATFVTDWKGDGTFPHCGAKNLQGIDWAHRVTWPSSALINFSATPVRLGYFYRSAAAVRTVACELYVPNDTTFYEDEFEFAIAYMDSTDVWRNESVAGVRALQLAASRTAIAASTATWTANGVALHSAKKLAITTAYPVKQNTEIIGRLSLATPRSPAVTIYVSPELVLT